MEKSSGDRLIEWLYGVLARPVDTLSEVAREKPVGLAFLVYLVVTILVMAANIYGGEGLAPLEELMLEVGIAIPLSVLMGGGLLLALVSIFVIAGLLHLLARLFGGKGGYWNFFSAYAFADFPMIITVPFTLIAVFAGVIGSILDGVITFGASIWTIVLQVIALRESYGLSTWASIGAYVIQLIIIIVIPLAIIIAFIAVLFLGI